MLSWKERGLMVADGLVMGVMGMAAVGIVLHDVEMVLC